MIRRIRRIEIRIDSKRYRRTKEMVQIAEIRILLEREMKKKIQNSGATLIDRYCVVISVSNDTGSGLNRMGQRSEWGSSELVQMTIGVLESHMGGIGNLLKRVSAYDTRPSAVCFLFRFTTFLLFLILCMTRVGPQRSVYTIRKSRSI